MTTKAATAEEAIEHPAHTKVWQVASFPHNEPNEEGAATDGLAVFILNKDTRQLVSKVAYVRRNSKNPDRSFEDQLKLEHERAQTACDYLNSSDDRMLV